MKHTKINRNILIIIGILSFFKMEIVLADSGQDPGQIKVLNYTDFKKDTNLVVLSAGDGDNVGLVEGSIIKCYRFSRPKNDAFQQSHNLAEIKPIWVETGILKIIEIQDSYSIAEIINQGSELSRSFFPKFPGVMAGDIIKPPHLKIEPKIAFTPLITLNYQNIFEDPTSNPFTFELTKEGKEKLTEAAKEFSNLRLSTLLVEGYTDTQGSAHQNQIESYQRALTVRQFLIDELGFDENRIVALGMGEAEQVDESQVRDRMVNNRRIVLKAIPTNQ